MAMLELKNVSKRYGDHTALEPIDLSLEAGETYVLLGTSGCGKSTLLKSALGLIEIDSGSVWVAGEELTADNVLSLRQRIGYVPQSGGLFPHLTALENVSLVARHIGWSPEKWQQRASQLAELVQLPPELMERYPSQLSGGQVQRVSVMRALMLDPAVLLMDEPLGALDPIIRAGLQADLRRVFQSLSKTVMIVTHDLHEAAYFADQVLLMNSGRVVQRGTIDQMLDAPAEEFVTRFIGAQRAVLGDSRGGDSQEGGRR